MSDFDRLNAKFQRLAGALDADLSKREREGETQQRSSTPDALRAALELHEEAVRVAAERRRDLVARRERASGANARADRDGFDELIAEIDREVPQLEQAIRAIRAKLPPESSGY